MKFNSIPEGWIPFTPVGRQISGTPFIAFKVPLKEMLCEKVEPDERFTPAMLMEKEPKLSLVIDLTNTTRYYNKSDFLDKGVQYVKINCPGRVIPESSIVQEFFKIVDDFVKSNKKKDALIGVHCTHGVNRTGYFICKYMIKKLGYEAAQAIASFQSARGHKIERLNYINDLFKLNNVDFKDEDIEKETRNNRPHKYQHSSRSQECGSQQTYYDDYRPASRHQRYEHSNRGRGRHANKPESNQPGQYVLIRKNVGNTPAQVPKRRNYDNNFRGGQRNSHVPNQNNQNHHTNRRVSNRGSYRQINSPAPERRFEGRDRRERGGMRNTRNNPTHNPTWLDITNNHWGEVNSTQSSGSNFNSERSNFHKPKFANRNLNENRGQRNFRGRNRRSGQSNRGSNRPNFSQRIG